MKKKILICAGGTGGHVFCGYALYDFLRVKDESEIDFLTDKRGSKYIKNIEYVCLLDMKEPRISTSDSKKSVFSNVFFTIFNKKTFDFIKIFVQNFFTVLKLILRQKYDVVIGFGGIATVLPIAIAKILQPFFKTKIIIHEQNAIIGKGNRFLMKFADFLTYNCDDLFENERSSKIIKQNLQKKIIQNPVRKEFYPINWRNNNIVNNSDNVNSAVNNVNSAVNNVNSAVNNVNSAVNNVNNAVNNVTNSTSDEFFTIVIFAGSQGADFFYNVIPFLFENIKTDKKIKIVQQVKNEYKNHIEKLYKSCNIECDLREFIYNMAEELQNANMAITRAGASTISELMACNCPAILIPYPYATDNHQLENAKFCEKNGCVHCFCENEISIVNASKIVEKMINDYDYLQKMSLKMFEYGKKNGCIEFCEFFQL